MITYGFFNSLDNDRKYNAESFNTFFEGLISSNGIFENVDGAFKVNAATGLSVNVATGKALVNNHWVKNDAVEIVNINAAHNLFARYDMICLRWIESERSVELCYVAGSASSTPVKPLPIKTTTQYDIVLAYVYIAPNSSNITTANIQDCRYDTALCGVIHGLIEQVDTSTLYNQYLAKFNEIEALLKLWEAEQKTQFETWFSALSEQLGINTYVTRKIANITTTVNEISGITIPESLNYESNDMLEVFVNGILLVEGIEYTIADNAIVLTNALLPDNVVTFYCYKSQIGWEQV